MTSEQLKALENRLWKAADELRANSKLTATEYSFPVLGIIFLRHAHNRFVTAKVEIEKSLPVHPTRGVRPMTKNDFLDAKAIFLPENSRWDKIVDLPDSSDLGEYLNDGEGDPVPTFTLKTFFEQDVSIIVLALVCFLVVAVVIVLLFCMHFGYV